MTACERTCAARFETSTATTVKRTSAATFVGLGDREGVGRRQEEEVVGERAGRDREERRPEAEADGDGDHGGEEHEVERLDADERLDRAWRRAKRGEDGEERHGIGQRGRVRRRRGPGAHGLLRHRLGRDLVAGDDVDADAAGAAHEVVDHRAVQHLEPARAGGLADDDLGDVVRPGVGEHVVGDRASAARQGQRLAAEALGEAQGVGDAVALHLGRARRCAASRS